MYNYQEEKPWLFEEAGFKAFLKARDYVMNSMQPGDIQRLSSLHHKLSTVAPAPNSFKQLALIDRLVELGELRRDVLKDSEQAVVWRPQ